MTDHTDIPDLDPDEIPAPPEPDPDAKPAAAADFRRQIEPLIVLPVSGLTVRVRRVSLMELAAAGRIPDHLTAPVVAALQMRPQQVDHETLREIVEPTLELVNAVCCAVMVEPRMAPKPRGNAIAPEDMHYRDRDHIYLWASGHVEAALPMRFPDGSTSGVAPVADEPGVERPTE